MSWNEDFEEACILNHYFASELGSIYQQLQTLYDVPSVSMIRATTVLYQIIRILEEMDALSSCEGDMNERARDLLTRHGCLADDGE